MTTTTLADVIVPEDYRPYSIQRSMERFEMYTSGLIAPVEGITIGDAGSVINMPFWQDLEGEDQVIDTGTDLTVSKIETGRDAAVVLARALVYGATDLAGALAGSDPMDAIAQLMGNKWNRRLQATGLAVMAGAMGALAAESPSVNTLDISALSGDASKFDAESFIDAGGQLGDAEQQLAAILCHSATERRMRKLGLIDYLPDDEGKPTIAFYQGKRVYIDDGMPYNAGVFETFLFGRGALGWSEGTPKTPVETQREALKNGGEEYLVERRHFILHPRGIKWTPASGVPAKDTPSNTELSDAGNWERVWDAKYIRMVRFVHTI